MSNNQSNSKSIHVADITTKENQIIRVEISEYRSKKYLNLRIWYKNENEDTDSFKPTPKGLTVSADLYEQLRDVILLAGEKINPI